jgi:hypothetical protein
VWAAAGQAGEVGFGPDEGEIGLGRTGERGGLRVGFCLGPVLAGFWAFWALGFSFLYLNFSPTKSNKV